MIQIGERQFAFVRPEDFAFQPRLVPSVNRPWVPRRTPVATVEWQGNYWTVIIAGETVWTGNDHSAAVDYAHKINGD